MTTDRLRYKLDIIASLGQSQEKLRDQAQVAAVGEAARVRAFKQAQESIQGLQAHVDKATDSGDLTEEERIQVKRWLVRACGAMENLQLKAESDRLAAHYRAQGLQAGLDLHFKAMDTTQKRMQQLAEQMTRGQLVAESEGVPATGAVDRAVHSVEGGRPGLSIAAQRKRERAAEEEQPPAEATEKKRKADPKGVEPRIRPKVVLRKKAAKKTTKKAAKKAPRKR